MYCVLMYVCTIDVLCTVGKQNNIIDNLHSLFEIKSQTFHCLHYYTIDKMTSHENQVLI